MAAIVALLLALFQPNAAARSAVLRASSVKLSSADTLHLTHKPLRLRVLVTAYCLRGRTFTGSRAGWGTVAVDPRVIELRARLYIPHYGYGYAYDTGVAVKGFHVDEWRSSCADAMRRTRFETITVWRHR